MKTLFLLSIFAFNFGQSLKCYSCNESSEDKNCADFDHSDRFIEECATEAISCMMSDRQKEATLESPFTVEQRGCWSTMQQTCTEPEPGLSRICTCDSGDLCNCQEMLTNVQNCPPKVEENENSSQLKSEATKQWRFVSNNYYIIIILHFLATVLEII